MLDLEKAHRMSLTMQVEVSLKSALIIGALKPGARLITKEIANQLGTSITPVREALLRLVSSGALTATPAQAFLVPQLTLERYDEINHIRKNLEGMAAAMAAAQVTSENIRELRHLCEAFVEHRQAGNVEQALRAHHKFRFRLYEYAKMPTLYALIEQLWIRIGPGFNYLYPQPENISSSQFDYQDLILALEHKDNEASSDAVCRAIDEGVSLVKNQYLR
ncbi:GntR family transcriptional regulator [Superficieibacter sp.]|uniref:GntR family transcriptional regulator n=1 Tax=Superficieibacter sp. TaxID=2303322 RepID=UPI0028B044B0|nr:GntR family transcriptional regulator [Superficieibacter sp.]